VTTALFKVEGAGNDFLLGVGEWATRLDAEPEVARTLCHRRKGIGADGVIALLLREEDRIEIIYRNADGSRGAFCANATRCSAVAAVELLGRPQHMKIVTGWGEIPAEVDGSQVTLELPALGSTPQHPGISTPDGIEEPVLMSVGVPHLVARVNLLSKLDIQRVAPPMRAHEELGPAGANVNFYRLENDGSVSIRTWERGVEGETLCCGSGVVSVALVVMAERGLDELVLTPASGDRMRVKALGTPPDCSTRLTGPARIVARIEPTEEIEGARSAPANR